MNLLINKLFAKIKALSLYGFIFKSFGKHSLIVKPVSIEGKKFIRIGNKVFVNSYSWIGAFSIKGKSPELVIDDGCTIGHFNHIISVRSVVIENNVITADRVYIADNLHSYQDPDIPVKDQPVVFAGKVRIGEGSWLGENVCIIGASVGKHCVIGANAVVTKDIPDYCVAVGIPAKVIKTYNSLSGEWENINQ